MDKESRRKKITDILVVMSGYPHLPEQVQDDVNEICQLFEPEQAQPDGLLLTDEEIEIASCDTSATHYGVNWQYYAVAEAQLAKAKRYYEPEIDLTELTKRIADYLTARFICEPITYAPKDECLSEAKYILSLAMPSLLAEGARKERARLVRCRLASAKRRKP